MNDYKSELPRVVNLRYEPCDVRICRPGKWGNPYIIGTHGTREEVIQKYEKYVRNNPQMISELKELEGKILGCFCAPKACHGDVLIKLIKEKQNETT